MSTILRLKIDLGVPVTVVENNDIGCDQVDSESTSPSSQQENELGAVGLVVFVNCCHSIFVVGLTVNTTVL